MASILDQFCGVAEESTYGTAITSGFRGYEATGDAWQKDVNYIESVGFRQNMETIRSDRHDTIAVGATGSIDCDVLNKGHGLLLKHLLGASSGPTQQASTAAYLQTFTTNDTGPGTSYTIQMPRVDTTGTLKDFTYEGCVATGFTIGCAVDEALKMTVDFDAEAEQTSTAASSPTYPTSADPFVFTQGTVEIADSAVSTFTSVELTGDLGMNTERKFLKGSAVKSQPVRSAVPSYTGTIEGEFSIAEYNAFVNGTVQKLEFIFTGETIASTYKYLFHVTMPAVKFTGSTPVASTDDLVRLSLPFTVLHDGSNPAITITYQSTDTAF